MKVDEILKGIVAFCIGSVSATISIKLTNDTNYQIILAFMIMIIGIYFLIKTVEKK